MNVHVTPKNNSDYVKIVWMDGRKFTILVQNVFVILEVTDDFMRSWCSSSKLIKFSTYYTL